MGTFYLRPIERPQLWLAGGTGLAPFLSMLECIKPEQLGHPIKLFYAVNRTADLVELDRLEKLAAVIGKVEIITIVADKDENHARQGYVTDHLSRNDLYDGNVDVYLCGPPPMVDAVRKNFVDLDCTPANFYFEKFNPKEMKEEAA
jgi:benzoate/toluate 1,2-dioxygenase reductase subunit